MLRNKLAIILSLVLIWQGCGSLTPTKPTPTNLSVMMPLIGVSAPASTTSGTLLADMVSDLSGRLTTTSATNCFNNISVTPKVNSLSCFGPTIGYNSHPNGTATNAGATGCPSAAAGCMNQWDLNVWTATEPSTSEACAVAEQNWLINDLAYLVNNSLKLTASNICAAQINGIALPTLNATATDISKYAQDAFLSGTITTATIARTADITGGKNTYVVKSNVSYGPIRYNITMIHSTLPDQSAYEGMIFGYADLNYSAFADASLVFPTSSDRRGFSAIYNFSGTTLTWAINGATVPTTVAQSNFIDSNNNYSYTTYLAGAYPDYRDAKYLVSSVTTPTGVGTAYMAWQNKPSDAYSRSIRLTSNGATGYSYIGFGPVPAATNYGTIGGTFCNWAGPGASLGSYNSTNVQSQTFSLSGGVMQAVTNNITFAPTNSCNTAGGSFKYGTISTFTGATVGPTVNNNFVNQTANGTIPTITAPVYP